MNDDGAAALLNEISDLRLKNVMLEELMVCVLTLHLHHLASDGGDARMRAQMMAVTLRGQMLAGLPAEGDLPAEQTRQREELVSYINSFFDRLEVSVLS